MDNYVGKWDGEQWVTIAAFLNLEDADFFITSVFNVDFDIVLAIVDSQGVPV